MNKLAIVSNIPPTGVGEISMSEVPLCDEHLAQVRPLAVTGYSSDTCVHCSIEWDKRWRHLISTNDWLGDIRPGEQVYISGPMSVYADHNHTSFALMEHALKMRDAVPINPCDHDHPDHPYAWLLRTALQKLLNHADKVVMLWNWRISEGATTELFIAQKISLPIYYEAEHNFLPLVGPGFSVGQPA